MSSVGVHLRDLREARGVSLDEISRVTRVARSYLDALENEQFAALPAPVFVRGFIRAYCETLGVSPHEALDLYERERGTRRTVEPSAAPRLARSHRQGGSHVMVSLVLVLVLGAALFAASFALQSNRETPGPESRAARGMPAPTAATVPPPTAQEGFGMSPAAPVTGAPPVPSGTSTALGGTPRVPDVSPSPGPGRGEVADRQPGGPAVAAAIAKESPPPISAVSPYRLTVRATETTWMRVRTEDGQHLGEETIPAGQVREWVSNRRFRLRIGNAGGVRLELNGRALPPLGRRGEVVEQLVLPAASTP